MNRATKKPQYKIWMTRKMSVDHIKQLRQLAHRRDSTIWQIHLEALAVGLDELARRQ